MVARKKTEIPYGYTIKRDLKNRLARHLVFSIWSQALEFQGKSGVVPLRCESQEHAAAQLGVTHDELRVIEADSLHYYEEELRMKEWGRLRKLNPVDHPHPPASSLPPHLPPLLNPPFMPHGAMLAYLSPNPASSSQLTQTSVSPSSSAPSPHLPASTPGREAEALQVQLYLYQRAADMLGIQLPETIQEGRDSAISQNFVRLSDYIDALVRSPPTSKEEVNENEPLKAYFLDDVADDLGSVRERMAPFLDSVVQQAAAIRNLKPIMLFGQGSIKGKERAPASDGQEESGQRGEKRKLADEEFPRSVCRRR